MLNELDLFSIRAYMDITASTYVQGTLYTVRFFKNQEDAFIHIQSNTLPEAGIGISSLSQIMRLKASTLRELVECILAQHR